jgi:hypothetical protein
MAHLFNKFVDLSAHGVKSFKDQAHISEFAKQFTALATGSNEIHHGVSYKELKSLI